MVRSAFAELYARHLGLALPASSAATVYRNAGIFPETARALRRRGVAEEALRAFRPTHLDDVVNGLAPGAVVFGMARHHLEALAVRPELRARARLLASLLGDDREIKDPVLEGADFARTFETVARCVEELHRRLLED